MHKDIRLAFPGDEAKTLSSLNHLTEPRSLKLCFTGCSPFFCFPSKKPSHPRRDLGRQPQDQKMQRRNPEIVHVQGSVPKWLPGSRSGIRYFINSGIVFGHSREMVIPPGMPCL